ncbi:uncharacterized protein I206_103223 [Kwoniella pini CBS 10737]|uniref:Ribosome biogenesis protein NSA1 n=1 Tax=Kwoniella pini CBS 10737 TaxID=1296096 RepID=A0A1B9IA35_9TREE|nr:uncharacterized protein I206_01772 [Kwoniella pini CBS 10737]OCF52482.1 hypothetical protein I206_01772 [Kwoniella pini CBS 10737]
MVQTLNFIVPSLYPNTLIDLSFPTPPLGLVPSIPEPIVQHLPIKYGSYQPLGRSKFMINGTRDDEIMIADDKFQISSIQLNPIKNSDEPENPEKEQEIIPPTIINQENVKARSKDVWAGLVNVRGGSISALTSGQITYHSSSSSSSSSDEIKTSSSSRIIPSPLQCITSTSLLPNSFVTAGKEVDISIWDIERTFGSSDQVTKTWENGKRKKNVLEAGQIWQAKNVPQNNLSLRQPINHLSLTYINGSPHHLVSGTKAGTIRQFDTRQRKPLSDWKVAREGGINCVVSGVENELFFSDHSNLLASLDLRIGKILYTYSNMTSTSLNLISIPLSINNNDDDDSYNKFERRIGLSSISSDSTFRIHTTTNPPNNIKEKGNYNNNGQQGKKGEILKIVGGIGIGQGLFRGKGNRNLIIPKTSKKNEGDDEEEEIDEEEIWKGMDEIKDQGKLPESGDEDEDEDQIDFSSESDLGEEDKIIIRSKPKKKVRKV